MALDWYLKAVALDATGRSTQTLMLELGRAGLARL